jgi:hypothetical protein
MIQYANGPEDISFTRNTFNAPDTGALLLAGAMPTRNLIFRDNIAYWGRYGFMPAKYAVAFGPEETLGERLSGNVFVQAAKTPRAKQAMAGENTFTATFEDALRSGKGADRAAIEKATANALDGGR